MPRIRELTLDSLKVKIAPLSWDEAEAYIKEGKEMLDRDPKVSAEDWAKRTLETVAQSMNRAAGSGNGTAEWNVKKLTAELDMVSIQEIYAEILKMSGLLPVRAEIPGEVSATSTSR
jgi:hypothetical protein